MNLPTWLRYTAQRLGVSLEVLGEMKVVDVMKHLASRTREHEQAHFDLDEAFDELDLLRSVERAAVAVLEDDSIPRLDSTCRLETVVDRLRRSRAAAEHDERVALAIVTPLVSAPTKAAINEFRRSFNAARKPS